MLCRYAVCRLNLLFVSIVITGLSEGELALFLVPEDTGCIPLLNGSGSVGGRSEETQMTWDLFLLLQSFGVYFTMRYQAAANLTVLISLLFPRHRGEFIRHKTTSVTKQISLVNFWTFHKQHCKCAMLCFKSDHSGPQILCTYDKCQCNFLLRWQFHR